MFPMFEFLVLCSSCCLLLGSHDSDAARGVATLGRVDYGRLSDQILMELMVRDIVNLEPFVDEEGEYSDV